MNYRKPKRTFELSGAVSPSKSYFVPLEDVTNDYRHEIDEMIDRGRYLSIFAPGRSGKTTCVEHFCRELEKDPAYIPILLRFRGYEAFDGKTFYKSIEKSLYPLLTTRLEAVNSPDLAIVQELLNSYELTSSHSLYTLFRKLNTMIPDKKIAIFIDDFDSFPLEELESFLTTARAMNQDFKMKKKKALRTICLVAVRNITKGAVRYVSPYNISDRLELTSFSLENIRDLYAQYTKETNQPFEEEAVEKIFEETGGQPWLVNRLGEILTTTIKPGTTDPITRDDADEAVNLLLKEKNPHFNNLLGKLMHLDLFSKIAQRPVEYFPDDEKLSHLERHGLIKKEKFKAVVANPIYKKRFAKLSPSKPLSGREKKFFISYSRKDKPWLDLLIPHLGALRYREIQYCYDEKTKPGEDWPPEIQHAIETSRVALCLVSANFLNSEFIRNREIPELLKRRKTGLKILPILVEPCAWKDVPWLAEIQIKDQIPLSESAPGDQGDKLVAIVDQIAEAFDEMQ